MRPWDSLSDDEKRLFAGWPRSTPASSATPTTSSGGCSTTSRRAGQLDNTIIVLVSDNGASGEGGPNGSVNENKFFNGIPDTIEENLQVPRRARRPEDLQPLSDRLGVGVQHAVQDVEALLELRGRHRRPDDRLLAAADHGERASAASTRHAVDIVPTIYECLGVELPDEVKGYTQNPLEGVSFAASFDDADAPTRQGDAVLLDARHAGDLAQGLEGGHRVSPAAPDVVGRLRTSSAGSSSTPRTTRASATTSPSSTRTSCRS